MVVLVLLMLSMIFLPACSATTTNSDTSLSEASMTSDTDQDTSSDTDNASTGGACSYYDSEMVFSSYAELETYVLENKILPENGKLFEVVSPYDGSEAFLITHHGDNFNFEFKYPKGDRLLAISYNYTGYGEQMVQSFFESNQEVVFPYEKVDGMYYCLGFDERDEPTYYVLYWSYDDFRFYASVPEEILDTAVENIVAGKYIR